MQLDRGHGQGVEGSHQRGQHQQVAVQRQERQHRHHVEQARQHGGIGAGAGVEERGERQAHLQADEFAGRLHGGENNAHREAHGDADQHLLHHHPQARVRARRHGRHGVQRGADRHGQHERQAHLDLHGHGGFREQRGGANQRQDTHERPEKLADPAVELFEREGDHGETSGAGRRGPLRTPAWGSGRSVAGCSRP
ncbi:hypothetical protein D3C87_1521640 [compost metagenome]